MCKVTSMRNTRIQYETSKYKLHKGTFIGHFGQLLDMDVTVIGHLQIFSIVVNYLQYVFLTIHSAIMFRH